MGWPDECRPDSPPGLTHGERRGRSVAKHRVGACVGMCGGGGSMPLCLQPICYKAGGLCTKNEPFEKRHVRGEHLIPCNVLPKELVGVVGPHEGGVE